MNIKTVIGIYNYIFQELNLEMNIKENNIPFSSKMDKTNFICSFNDNVDLNLSFIHLNMNKNNKSK